MSDSFTFDVFLSYSSEDRDVVTALADRLRRDGLRVWFDQWQVRPGDLIPLSIREGLEQSRVLVFCMSKHTFGSDWAQLESGAFHFSDPANRQRRFLPLRLDDVQIPGSLRQFRYIDWRKPDGGTYAELLHACKRGSGAETIDAGEDPPTAGAVLPLDLWTPGNSESTTIAHYAPLVGAETANKLWGISLAGQDAVSAGDFQRQVEIGAELILLAPDNRYLVAEGRYFAAEGHRLLATLTENEARTVDLHEKAMELYRRSAELLPEDPRPVRGIGRLLQVQGRYDDALREFMTAKGRCIAGLAGSIGGRRDLAHEALRTTRHTIHCILDMQRGNPASQWNRARKRPELEGLLVECENLHRDYLPAFEQWQAWSSIEWFMGLVFIGNAWTRMGNSERGRLCFTYALRSRDEMMARSGELSPVERANLRWWLSVSGDRAFNLGSTFNTRAEALAATIELGDRTAVHNAIEDLVTSILPR